MSEDHPAGTTDPTTPPVARPAKKRRWWRWALAFALLLLVLRSCATTRGGKLRGPEDTHLLVFAPPAYTHTAPGRLVIFGNNIDVAGDRVERREPFDDGVGAPRNLIVYEPPEILDSVSDPLIVVYPGYLDTPTHMLASVVGPLAAAMAEKNIEPALIAVPDVSIGGNGADDPATPLDDRLGHWGVDSNLGRFETQLVEGVIPRLRETYGLTPLPNSLTLIGYSVGGNIALAHALKHPDLARTVVAISPALNTRYSIGGARLRPYSQAGYQDIADDNPDRPILRGGPLGTFTDRWAFWPIFDSDAKPGPVWTENRPVWERLRDHNPVDLAAREDLDLSGLSIYLVAGDKDIYFFQHHIPLFAERVKARGAKLSPDNPVRPGNHSLNFVAAQMPEAIAWLSKKQR